MKQEILITCGDPNGIGPELALKLFNLLPNSKKKLTKFIGTRKAINFYSKILKLRNIPEDNFIEIKTFKDYTPEPGLNNKTGGKISIDTLSEAITFCLEKKFRALVTLPLSKEAVCKNGLKFTGHTEYLREKTGSGKVFMIMYSRTLKIVPLTIHIPLKKVSGIINEEYLYKGIISLTENFSSITKINNPLCAVLSLNPHSGDGGITGNEEKTIFVPALKRLKHSGINAEGPFSADGFFGAGLYRNFDLVIAIYHDQAMIPFKILSKGKGVNLTVGLPFVRTSPSHGTAFDIAGKGKAMTDSTLEAFNTAFKLSQEK